MRFKLRTIDNRQVDITLGVVVERSKSSHPWADWVWKPVSVFINAPAIAQWEELLRQDDVVQYHAATVSLTLHRRDTEALRENLMLPEPELYVALREADDANSDYPYDVHLVSASPYEAQDMTDAGDDIVEKVAMPEAVAAFIQAFVEEHHVEEKFIKRKRDKLKIEDQKFGKIPIFANRTKH